MTETVTTAPDRRWLGLAVDLARLSPPSPAHYAVGAAVVGRDGTLLATGYTGETDPAYHAEEAALVKLGGWAGGTTLYTSLEPCTTRRSRPHPCTDLILSAGVRRVVLALREPLLFADCHGVETLRDAGVEVVEIGELAAAVREVNAHLLGPAPAALRG
jgi:diaminohydroxyphosphoribosylaminopyrimidine deaminase/5-amino-6-(5-phosphoribosylamino)uracil reductase